MKRDDLWIPDNPDGSGWADVDWPSVVQGTKYHYEHGLPLAEAVAKRPRFYKVITRLESDDLQPHHNSYFVSADKLADLITEFVWNGGAEQVWHVEPCDQPPDESGASTDSVE